MKATTLGLVIAAAFAPGLALADLTNGDCETGDLTGWSTDTDGLGPPTPLSPDFQVVAAPPISAFAPWRCSSPS